MTEHSAPRWSVTPDPERDLLVDARSLRAVAHPVRLRMLDILREEGPSTATRLAKRLGLNSGATSYHLRQLAAYGLIVEDAGRGSGRDRWWRIAHRFMWFTAAAAKEVDPDDSLAYMQAVALTHADRVQRAIESIPTLPADWQNAQTFSQYPLCLTSDEARQLLTELRELLGRYRPNLPGMDQEEPAPPGAQPYQLQVQAFVRPGQFEADDVDEAGGSDRPDIADGAG